jgi:hypothetical protein
MAWTDDPTEAQLNLLYAEAGRRVAPRYGTCGEERREAVGAIVENRTGTMTRRDVSQWIDWFKRQPYDNEARQPRTQSDDGVDINTLEFGIYEHPTDGLYAVKPSRSNRDRRFAAKVEPVASGRVTDGGSIVKVEFRYEKGAIFKLRPDMRISVERAEELSIEYKHCICCGHGIKVIDSVLRGIGPVCLGKYFSNEEQQRIKARVKELKARARERELEGAVA